MDEKTKKATPPLGTGSEVMIPTDPRATVGQLREAIDVLKERYDTAEEELAYWRRRCPVIKSDLDPRHTVRRTWDYMLANGWTIDDDELWMRHSSGKTFRPDPIIRSDIPAMCNRHAEASNIGPHDVLAAIGDLY